MNDEGEMVYAFIVMTIRRKWFPLEIAKLLFTWARQTNKKALKRKYINAIVFK